MTNGKETWRQVKDFPLYEVSSFGRVRSNIHTPPMMLRLTKMWHNGCFLVHVALHGKGMLVHRLVAGAFVRGKKRFVIHKNGDTQDNRAENLAWSDKTVTRFGRPRKYETRPPSDSPRRGIPVTASFPDGTTMAFESITAAFHHTGVGRTSITRNISGAQKKTFGQKGKYKGMIITWRAKNAD